MTRPVLWASVLAVLIAVGATGSGAKLATSLGKRAPEAPVTQVTDQGAQVVFVDGDLGGHFTLYPAVEGQRVRMLVDTGATSVALRHEDAIAIGLKLQPADFTRRMSTANGLVAGAPVRIREIRIGAITVRNVDAVVMPAGRLGVSLLGMSFLKRLGGFEVQHGRLKLLG